MRIPFIPASTSWLATLWASLGGSGDNPDVDFPLSYDIFQFADMIYDKSTGESFPHLLGIGIESRREDISVLYEIAVTHKRRSKIAKSHHCEVPGAVQPENVLDLIDKVVYTVSYPSDSEFAKVGQILTDLGRIDTALLCQPLGGYDVDVAIEQLLKGAHVNREPDDCRHRDFGKFHFITSMINWTTTPANYVILFT